MTWVGWGRRSLRSLHGRPLCPLWGVNLPLKGKSATGNLTHIDFRARDRLPAQLDRMIDGFD